MAAIGERTLIDSSAFIILHILQFANVGVALFLKWLKEADPQIVKNFDWLNYLFAKSNLWKL